MYFEEEADHNAQILCHSQVPSPETHIYTHPIYTNKLKIHDKNG